MKLFLKIRKFEGYIYPILFLFILLFAVGFLYTRSHYVDIFSLCDIAVDKDFLDGNSKSIMKAIGRIKYQDKDGYKDVCKYVNLVSENLCPVFHTYGGSMQYNNQAGCFIKGSKVIFITPNIDDSENIINQRAEAIKKYADLSKNYWENYNK